FAPVITSAIAWAIVWKFLLQGECGFINQVLALVGITGPNCLREPSWAMAAKNTVRKNTTPKNGRERASAKASESAMLSGT
ncbi:hypothetical protein AB9F41_36655, partial [Rhizobium leguminosarum]